MTDTVAHGAEFRNLPIQPALLLLKAKDGCINDLIRKFWNCHYVHLLTFWHDSVSGYAKEGTTMNGVSPENC